MRHPVPAKPHIYRHRARGSSFWSYRHGRVIGKYNLAAYVFCVVRNRRPDETPKSN